MSNKNIRSSLFIPSVILSMFLVLLASSMQAEANPDAFDSVIIQNGTIIGGSSTGASGTLRVSPVTAGPRNFSIRGVYYNTTPTTWARATLAGVSGNSSCVSNKCNHTTDVRGAMAVTFTLPSDVTRTHLRVEENSTATTYANESRILTIDSAGPTFTLYPAESFISSRSNRTVNVTVTTNENASSVWLYVTSIGRNFSRTLDTAGTYALDNSADTRWATSFTVGSDQLISYYARAYDYAADGGNGATSSIRTFQLNTGPSRAAKAVVLQQAGQSGGALGALGKVNPLLIIGIGIVLYLVFKKGRRS